MTREVAWTASTSRLVCCIRLFDIIFGHATSLGVAWREDSQRRRSRRVPGDRKRRRETASGGVAVCPCGPPVQPRGERRSSRAPPEPLPGTPPQDRHAGSRTTDTLLRHRPLLPVEGSVVSTTGSDLPQNLVPGDPELASLLDVSVQIIQPLVELRALLGGDRHVRRRPRKAIPQALKEIQTLLRAKAIDLDRRVAHNPILSPVAP
jgi:hypothetical protein